MQMQLKRLIIRTVLALAMLFVCTRPVQAQQFAFKVNALNLALLTPDLGFSAVVGEHSSVELSLIGNYKPYGLPSKLFVVQPEYRYWFNGRPLTREFIGATAFAATYNMALGRHVFKGDAIGAGLVGGYLFYLGPKWSLELSGGFGVLVFRQLQYGRDDNFDDYHEGEVVSVNSSGYKLFPMKVGVSFIYIVR